MSHPETNPHFIRPLQHREGSSPHTQPPQPSHAVKRRAGPVESPNEPQNRQNQPPLPLGVRPQGQRSKPKGPRGDDAEYHTPWLIPSQHPTPKEDHQAHDPKRDREYRSPWMQLPHHQNEGLQEPEGTIVTKPQYHDHDGHDIEDQYPIHPRGSKPPPKATRKKPQKQRSQHHEVTIVTQPKQHNRDHDHEQDHYPLHPRNSKPSPRQVPEFQRTGALTWLIAAFCALFWIVVFLGGLIVLILYLVYRPRSPKFDISNASLNAAYVDAGALLNADISLLANFTNPNKKAGVEFSHMIIDLYYGNKLIATQNIESFSVARAHSMFANVHMVTSQVRLTLGEITRLQDETDRNAIILHVKGVCRVRSNLGSFLRYSYRLYSHCTIMLSASPGGVLRGTRCKTKR